MTLRNMRAEVAAKGVAEEKHLLLAEIPPDPGDQFVGVGNHAFGRQGRLGRGGVVGQVGLPGGSLVPIDDGEVLSPQAVPSVRRSIRRGRPPDES